MSAGVADVAVVGGGIVGLASAWALRRARPDARIVLLEKERGLARHQTGRNSGVIHSGIYYVPGSQKAQTCRLGRRMLLEFCAEHGVAHEVCGKVIVAVDEAELPRLARIRERGEANGVDCREIGPEELRELEPHAAGVRALHVRDAGIVDYPGVCETLGRLLREAGVEVVLGARVEAVEHRGGRTVLRWNGGEVEAARAVNCAGLQSDLVRRLGGRAPAARVVPFRGEYYELEPEYRHLCRNLIYPVPDPSFPFLGVHFTRMVDGSVECGPNAVLALAREGYRWRDVSPRELGATLAYSGFLRLAAKHWRMGSGEVWRSLSKRAFVRALQRLVPAIEGRGLVRAPAGVRAQLVAPDGALVDDFLFERDEGFLHVCNAPSPAATAALEIGRRVAEQALA